jgi:hypothetical protein
MRRHVRLHLDTALGTSKDPNLRAETRRYLEEKGKALMDTAAIETTDESNAAKQLQKLKGESSGYDRHSAGFRGQKKR